MSAKYSDIELPVAQRARALAKFRQQLARWNLKMPRVRPLVMNLGLRDFDKIGLIEFWVANEAKVGYCGKCLSVFDSQKYPYHHHELKHETFFVMKGLGRMTVNGMTRILNEGSRLGMPTGMKQSFEGTGGPALLPVVSQPSVRRDNFFRSKRIGRNGLV